MKNHINLNLKGNWNCARCTSWLSRTGAKVLSANAEEEARAMADGAVLRKVVKSKKRKYFVKWRGLSYRDSTWETAKVTHQYDVLRGHMYCSANLTLLVLRYLYIYFHV